MSENQNTPQPGTPEYDEWMRQYYGDSFELGYRVGFGKRLGAFIVDAIFIMIISTIVVFTFGSDFIMELGKSFENSSSGAFDMSSVKALQVKFAPEVKQIGIISGIAQLLYWSLEIFIGASFGKFVLGLKIASDDRNPANITKLLTRFVFRHAGLLFSFLFALSSVGAFETLSSIGTFAFIIGAFFTLSTKRQALHDIVAKTSVYHKSIIKKA